MFSYMEGNCKQMIPNEVCPHSRFACLDSSPLNLICPLSQFEVPGCFRCCIRAVHRMVVGDPFVVEEEVFQQYPKGVFPAVVSCCAQTFLDGSSLKQVGCYKRLVHHY